MSFENQKLDQEEAQREANMMRAKVGIDPETGEIPTGICEEDADFCRKFGKPTAEDYDRALTAVEEMKKLAIEEPAGEKIEMKLDRIAEQIRWGAELLLTLGFTVPAAKEAEHWERVGHRLTMEQLSSAEEKLRQLKEKAQEFENTN